MPAERPGLATALLAALAHLSWGWVIPPGPPREAPRGREALVLDRQGRRDLERGLMRARRIAS